MKAENFFYIITIVGIFGLFATMLYFETNETVEPIQQVDYSDRFDKLEAGIENRFDRIETGIANTAIDVCFQWGGQWLTDENGFIMQDFEIPMQNGLFARGQAIMCIKQKEVRQ